MSLAGNMRKQAEPPGSGSAQERNSSFRAGNVNLLLAFQCVSLREAGGRIKLHLEGAMLSVFPVYSPSVK